MKRYFLLIALIAGCCVSCLKEPSVPTGSSKITIGATTVDSIKAISVTAHSSCTVGFSEIEEHGFCWGKGLNPDLSGNHKSLGGLASNQSFSASITGLSEGTRYYILSYVKKDEMIIYGTAKEFTTTSFGFPIVITASVTGITIASAMCGGNVTSDGNGTVSARGVCWNTSGNPTLTNSINHTLEGIGTGQFTSSITGLTNGTTYYVAAYAMNEKGTSYGEIKQFLTLQLLPPQVATADVTNVTATTATCGGNVTSDGNGTVSARGVCWNTSGNPTLTNSTAHTTDGTGKGAFASQITSLTSGIKYYVTAYATNENSTAYGSQKQFLAENPCGQLVVTYGGKNYSTIQIGTQCWFKENLNIGTRIYSGQQQTDNGIIEKYCYNDFESNCDIYGGLYQWDELMQYVIIEGARGLCPDGWHIPTDAEWSTLTTYLGGESVAGGKMKETGTTHWEGESAGTTNISGFTALPGGECYNGTGYLRQEANIWSSTQDGANDARFRNLWYDIDNVNRGDYYKYKGYSARCLHD